MKAPPRGRVPPTARAWRGVRSAGPEPPEGGPRRRRPAGLARSLWTPAASAAAPTPAETEKLAAWARLYGVMRWFHPSDAAQQIDWNRLAVRGVKSTRAAN